MKSTKKTTLAAASLLAALPLIAACGGDLKPDNEDNAETTTEKVVTVTEGGISTTTVDASDKDAGVWVYFSLETGAEVEVTDPDTNNAWDLRFHRMNVDANSPHHGNGSVLVAPMFKADYDSMTEAPAAPVSGYITDSQGVDGMGGGNNRAIMWWDYDVSDHSLAPLDFVYVIRSNAGNFYKLKVLSYYNAVGTSGMVSFKWSKIDSPAEGARTQMTIDASSNEDWVYVNLGWRILTQEDKGWDLALRRTALRTHNDGKKRLGGAAPMPEGKTYATLTEAPTFGYQVDTEITPPHGEKYVGSVVMQDWYNYDMSSHTVSPKDDAEYLVRGAYGDAYKVKIVAFDDGKYQLDVAPVPMVMTTQTSKIQVPATGAAYFSFRRGAVVQVEDPSTDLSWDLALWPSWLQTNGGASGKGQGAALPASGELDAVEAPGDKAVWQVDVEVTSGDAKFTHNAPLSKWADDDAPFVLRTADGGFVRLKIKGLSDDHTYEIEWAYAGAGRDEF